MNVITRPVEFAPDDTRPMACTKDVCDSLGVTVTPMLIENRLGVKADFRRKSAYYWTAANVETIRAKLVDHLASL